MLTDVGNVPVVTTGSNDGFGGSGIWAVLLLAILGGGCGFGGRGDCGNETARETQIINDTMNSRFNSLEGMNEFRYMAQANNINHIENMEATRDQQREICETKSLVQATAHENALIAKNAEIANLRCCCETQTQMASGFTMLAQKMDQNEIQNLRDKVSDLQLGYSQCQQNSALISALRPYPSPSYVTYNPQQSFFPPQPSVAAGAAYGAGCGCGF